MSDLIDRQAAIDALKEEEYPCENDYDEGYMAALDKAVWIMGKWLPSAQPGVPDTNVGDIISRQAAIDAVDKLSDEPIGYLEAAIDALADLPSAEPEPQWIPCSERLPENKSYVLTTIYIPGRVPHSRSGWFEDGLFMNDNGDTWNSTDREVVAWMPLPAPYRAERREK